MRTVTSFQASDLIMYEILMYYSVHYSVTTTTQCTILYNPGTVLCVKDY